MRVSACGKITFRWRKVGQYFQVTNDRHPLNIRHSLQALLCNFKMSNTSKTRTTFSVKIPFTVTTSLLNIHFNLTLPYVLRFRNLSPNFRFFPEHFVNISVLREATCTPPLPKNKTLKKNIITKQNRPRRKTPHPSDILLFIRLIQLNTIVT